MKLEEVKMTCPGSCSQYVEESRSNSGKDDCLACFFPDYVGPVIHGHFSIVNTTALYSLWSEDMEELKTRTTYYKLYLDLLSHCSRINYRMNGHYGWLSMDNETEVMDF